MPIEVCTISGFSKTGGNSIAFKIDEEVVILDMGLSMENYIRYTEDREDVTAKNYRDLLHVGAVPDYSYIEDWKNKVIAIIPSHAHLDHLGAIPFAAGIFPKAPVICTPYSLEVLKSILADDHIIIPNKLVSLNLNSSYKLSKKITVEFVYITHSLPHTAMIVLHTPYGKIVYANDYKIDLQPTLGQKPNLERLKEIGKEGVILLVMECLYAQAHIKTPSEGVAKQLLKDVMLGVNSEGKAMIVTTFSSHMARLKSIVELGKKLNRKIVFLGRSLSKYVKAAENINIINFEQEARLVGFRDKVEKTLKGIMKEGKGKYLIVCTGHQGEPHSVLSRLAQGETSFRFESGDIVIFSCSVIPVELNRENRARLEQQLKSKNVRLFTDVHVSGHAAREDYRDLLDLLKPEQIIPSHAGHDKAQLLKEYAQDLGYRKVQIMDDGKRISI